MKNLFVLLAAAVLLVSCTATGEHGTHKKINESAAIKVDSVPLIVVLTFYEKYPLLKPERWYKLDKNCYAVRFIKGTETGYAYFHRHGEYKDERSDKDRDYYDPKYDRDSWEPLELDIYY